MQLHPQEEFVIARGLEDHTDSTTYYVRAVIRNAKTDDLIATLDLTDQGDGHRFTKRWQVPADPTGEGFYILVTTSVYTDSGYTAKSDNYGDKYEEHLIYARMNPILSGSGGGDVDYKKVRQIIQEELDKRPPAEFPTIPEMPNVAFHLKPVLNALSGLRNDLQSIEIPKTDLSGLEESIRSVQKAIKDKEVTPQTELKPVLEDLAALENTIVSTIKQSTTSVTSSLSKTQEQLEKAVKQSTDTVIERLDEAPIVSVKAPSIKQPVDDAVDYHALLNS